MAQHMAGNPLKTRQILTFAVSWIAYASTYLLRKPLGVVSSRNRLSKYAIAKLGVVKREQ